MITQCRLLTTATEKPFENIVGKEENTGNERFLLFPQCFLPFTKQISNFHSRLFCPLHMLSIWTSPKMCHLVKAESVANGVICCIVENGVICCIAENGVICCIAENGVKYC